MLWIILIVLIIVGVYAGGKEGLKLFGQCVSLIVGITFACFLLIYLIIAITTRNDDVDNKKQQEAYWEKVIQKQIQTPLIQWACNSDGYQLHLGQHPKYVYQCSTGELIAEDLSVNIIGDYGYYTCLQKPHKRKQVNHWKFCKPNTVIKNSNYNHLLGN